MSGEPDWGWPDGVAWHADPESDYEDDEDDDIELTVCTAHARFVPCRRCKPGEERYSTDPADVERTRVYQQGAD